MSRVRFCVAAFIAIGVLLPTSARSADVKIDEVIVAASFSAERQEAAIKAARAFYQFWNDGNEASLKQTIAPDFTDRTLPNGRPQGPEGPAFASRQFREAVPDLQVEVRKLIVAGDYVTVHMQFTGHFTGTFGNVKGSGQSIDFIATDLLKITNGRISDNWHIEDNLTLLSKMGIAKIGP